MPLLHIALQEGFAGEPVVLRCQQREVFNQPDVKTRTQIGLATTFEEELPTGPVSLEVNLPKRNLTKTVSLTLSQATYVGVSVSEEGRIVHTVSSEPFGYV